MRAKRQPIRRPRTRSALTKAPPGFDVVSYLESATDTQQVEQYRPGAVIFSQGDSSTDIRYIQKGAIKISVLSRIGKEAVVAMLGPGDFFGEGTLAGQVVRIETATAVASATVRVIGKEAMVR